MNLTPCDRLPVTILLKNHMALLPGLCSITLLTSCCGTGKEIVPCRKICYKNPCTCLHQPMTLWQGVCYAHSPGKSAPVPVVLAHRNPPRHSSPGQAAL